ncbi:hypothetical protein KSP40_PGU022001 [Platanthera guangdongensis]|uniref:Uncharacterized protein n=1 Tax=Platanthera guangdongensis TaxID=2320717 RepID=A0ABR2MVN1_9ASPA
MAALLASKALPPLLPVGGGFRQKRSLAVAASLSRICKSPATRRRGFDNGASVLACSTSFPFKGRAGWGRREASASLFSSGGNPAGAVGDAALLRCRHSCFRACDSVHLLLVKLSLSSHMVQHLHDFSANVSAITLSKDFDANVPVFVLIFIFRQ